ncbi:MAG TPA: amidohydrolase family protein [Candidatus Methylomirabilis sp.]|nr:amidohydrolase family protein [Candidatus Methylomirabilis sp.]
MASRVMSADCHMDLFYLPPDAFTARMDPARWGDRIPHVVERDGTKVWVSAGAMLSPWGVYGPGVTAGKRGRILVREGFAAGRARASDPVQRRADQERDGVEAEVIYGILGVSRGLLGGVGLGDPELLADVYRAYNEYIADFNRTEPGRYIGLGCLPNHGVDAAVGELRRCAGLGLKGATFVPWGSAMPVWHPMWEPMWAAAEALDIVITFHVFEGGAATVGRAVKESHPASAGAWTAVAPAQLDEILCSVILAGVCERHPRLRLVLGESGIGWLPYMLERLDDTWEERLTDDCPLSLPPSSYFKRQIYATFQKDFHGVKAMSEIAPDNVMWGSDYPHRDGTWPFSQKVIEEQFRGIDPSIAGRMLWDNARRVYRLG